MKRIYDKLKADGLSPFFPGQKVGVCKAPYTVILEGTQFPMNSRYVGNQKVDILIYVPVASYIALDLYRKSIVNSLNSLDFFKKTGFETSVIIEDDIDAYSKSLEYVILKKLEG